MARGKGGGEGGGDKNAPNFKLYFAGKRDKATVTVRAFRGKDPAANEMVGFFVGTATEGGNPFKHEVQRAGAPWQIRIGDRGIGSEEDVDFTSYNLDDYTHLTAVWGSQSSTAPIPLEVKLPGKGPDSKRLKVTPEGNAQNTLGGAVTKTVKTFKKDGKTPEPGMTVRMVASKPVTIKDVKTDDILRGIRRGRRARNVKFFEFSSGPNGIKHLEFTDEGSEFGCQITLFHVECGEEKTFEISFF